MAIALDSGNNGAYSPGVTNPVTWSHTCSGSNGLLLVSFFSQQPVSSVTYNGVSMNQLTYVLVGGLTWYSYIYGLLGPTTGTNTVSVTTTIAGFVNAVSTSYTGVLQSGLPDNSIASDSGGNASTYTKTLATVADNCWVYGAAIGVVSLTASTGITQRGIDPDSRILDGDSNGIVHPAGNYSMTATSSGAYYMAIHMCSLAPSVAGGGNIGTKTLLGVGV